MRSPGRRTDARRTRWGSTCARCRTRAVEELEEAASADATSGELVVTDGPFAETKEWLGGLTIVDVPDDESARMWAGRVAEGCGWPQEVRRFKAGSLQALVLGE
jgi:hypothetical protein